MTRKHKKLGEKTIKIKDEVSGYDKEIIVKTFRLPTGVIENSFIDKNKSSVQIFPITADGRVITVQQFRPGNESLNLELPGGGLEEGEDPEEAAARELQQESGYKGRLRYLGKQPYNPYCTGEQHMFVAYDCRKVAGLDLDDNEFLRVVIWPMRKFINLMQKSKVRGHVCAYMGLHALGLISFKI